MARWSWVQSGSTWTDATAQTARSGAAKLNSITVTVEADQGAGFVQGWDSITATAGTTAPDFAFKIPAYTVQSRRRYKVIFPEGIVCATGIQVFISTAAGGATAVTTTAIPDEVIVDFTPMA